MKAISVKFLPPTATKPRRFKAFDMDGNSVTIKDPEFVRTPSNYHYAAESLRLKMGWSGVLIGGATKQGWVFVFAY